VSNFAAKVRNKETGEEKDCAFMDNYFGRRQYGFLIDDFVLTYEEFNKEWEKIK
jgi:hypothetical protein